MRTNVNYSTYITKSIRHYRKAHLLLMLMTLVTGMIITGALMIGDSVRSSLKAIAEERIGQTEWALHGGDRYFRIALTGELSEKLQTIVVPLVMMEGTAGSQGGQNRIPNVQVVVVDDAFWKFAPKSPSISMEAGSAFINHRLANRLNLKAGDTFVLRLRSPSALPTDFPFAANEGNVKALRLDVGRILTPDGFGHFSLKTHHIPQPTVFISLAEFWDIVGEKNNVNTLLISRQENPRLTLDKIQQALDEAWKIEDAALSIKPLPGRNLCELKSRRIFLSQRISKAARTASLDAAPIFSYFVNTVRGNLRETPYSIVSSPPPSEFAHIKDDEIVINQWLAEDLNVRPGDNVEIDYYVVDETRRLHIRKNRFTVHAIIPLSETTADPGLMPDFPGLHDVENCRDWDPGIPVDLDRIRDKDEQYWDLYRGTPKAFFTLKSAQNMWSNPFGDLTGIRFPLDQLEAVSSELQRRLGPADVGLQFRGVREQALRASRESVDFAGLFLGLSFFILVSALILTGLVFVLFVEWRQTDIGFLKAMGFREKHIIRLFMVEGGIVALMGSLAAVPLAVLYTHGVLGALKNMWIGAVGTTALQVAVRPQSLLLGFFMGFGFALLAMALASRRLFKKGIADLQPYADDLSLPIKYGKAAALFSIGLFIAVIVLLAISLFAKQDSPLLFFLLGTLLLIQGLVWTHFLFSKLNAALPFRKPTLRTLFLRNTTRHPGRNLAVVTLLSVGLFIVVAVSMNRKEVTDSAEQRSSGTGGFSLFCETTHPVNKDLNSPKSRREMGLVTDRFENVAFVPLRLKPGDDASCLNLNRTTHPHILGVNPALFKKRKAFSFAAVLEGLEPKKSTPEASDWSILDTPLADGSIPAVADQTVIQWGLGKKIGDTLVYLDESGQSIRLKLVAGLANSIFQGYILISEDHFLRHFPSASGHNLFLVDGLAGRQKDFIEILKEAFTNFGIEVMTTRERLAMFNRVENTYLSIFAALGGLGLILGTAGLGILLLRNTWERKKELALLRAIGFRKKDISRIVIQEYGFLLILGVAIGTISGLIAVFPAIRTSLDKLPLGFLLQVVALIVITGFGSLLAAALVSLKGDILGRLREE